MKYNINVIKSVWGRLRKPSRATLAAFCSQNPQNYPAYEAGIEVKRKAQMLDSAVWQHMARLEPERHDLLTMAKTVVRLRDITQRRPIRLPLLRKSAVFWPLTVFSS
jgi:hypothetical protein